MCHSKQRKLTFFCDAKFYILARPNEGLLKLQLHNFWCSEWYLLGPIVDRGNTKTTHILSASLEMIRKETLDWSANMTTTSQQQDTRSSLQAWVSILIATPERRQPVLAQVVWYSNDWSCLPLPSFNVLAKWIGISWTATLILLTNARLHRAC